MEDRIKLFAKRVEEAQLVDIEDLIVVYMVDNDPKENNLWNYGGRNVEENLLNLANECDEILYVVDNHGNNVNM